MLVSACYLKNFGLTMICIITQSCALAWWGIGYPVHTWGVGA